MPYEHCREVNETFWNELAARGTEEVVRRTGVVLSGPGYLLPHFGRTLLVEPARRSIAFTDGSDADPGFHVCLTALLYLLEVDPAALGHPVSPLQLPGGAIFFRGPHGLPQGPLEARFGRDLTGFQAAAARLGGIKGRDGDGAYSLEVYPGLRVGVILWLADEELPAQVSFTVPAHLERCWHLDAVWALLHLAARELLAHAP